MILMKDLKRMLDILPDNSVVTINGNYNVDIVSVFAETTFDGIRCDLKLTPGYSITKDSVMDAMFGQLKERI